MLVDTTIKWNAVQCGEMPKDEGTYMIAWSDGSVESFPLERSHIEDGKIRCGGLCGEYWALHPEHPDA